jgi:thiamine-phosphate pyrophosphorylase
LVPSSETDYASKLAEAGVRLLQYRNKTATARRLLESSQALARTLSPRGVRFLVNDRADIAALAQADGVHLGQDDLAVEQARRLLGPEKWIGVSTHNLEQFERAAATSADYVAVGPVFATASKSNPDPVVGLEFLRQVRRLTPKPIVAIGGITLDRAAELIESGADSVAVIADILKAPNPFERARLYVKTLEAANQAAV